MEATETPKETPSTDKPWPSWRRRDTEEARLQEAEHLREDLSCVPFYANQARIHKELTGDEMGYWLSLYGSAQYTRRPSKTSPTPEITPPSEAPK